MKRLSLAVLSAGLFLVLASSYSFAEMDGPGRGQGRGCPNEGMMKSPAWHEGRGHMKRGDHFATMLAKLGLDDKQKESVASIRSKVKKETVMKRAEIEVARIDLKGILAKDQVDMAAVETLLKKTAALHTDIHLAHIKSMQEIKAVLTPEQRKKLKELRQAGPRETMPHHPMESNG